MRRGMAGYALEKEMKRFFVDKITNPPVIYGDEHKHLSVVLRAKPGEQVALCLGDGYDYICKIEKIHKDETVLSFVDKVQNLSEPSINVTLFMSVMKGDKNDLVVQKATELGVCEIYPVITKYVQGYDRNIKNERLNKIAAEAAKQCGRSTLTKVQCATEFSEILPLLCEFDVVVFAYEKAEDNSLKDFLSLHKNGNIKNLAVIIGPEGGFAEEEVKTVTERGITPVTLGKRILRAETANIAVLSAVMYELEQWK